MSAVILRFPLLDLVRVQRERDAEGWVVIGPRGHGWLHGDFHGALDDARWIAAGYGVAVQSSAECVS